MAASSVADEEDFLFQLPSDTEAAVAMLLGQCPTAIRPRSVAVVLVSQCYAVVNDRTAVDQEIEERRLSNAWRVLQLPSSREERVLVKSDAYANAMAADASNAEQLSVTDRAALEAASKALPTCTGVAVRKAEIEATLADVTQLDAVVNVLKSRGWLIASPRPTSLAPDEAPALLDQEWLWALPESGRLTRALYPLRSEVLKLLHRQRFGRALCLTIERSASVAKLLRSSPIDLSFALRDLVGSNYIETSRSAAGVTLQLTAAGERAAAAVSASNKRRR